jgi:nitrite reductase/ring-hydroxylating ferredoxin subunit
MKTYKLFDSVEAAEKRIPYNSRVRVDAGGRNICVGNGPNGFFAVDDACPHLGASLCQGHTNNMSEIICPWHGYRFNLQNGEEDQQRTADLKIHKITLEDDGVYLVVE